MRQVNTCGFHQFTCAKCPVCEPDELRNARSERAWKLEMEILQLMRLDSLNDKDTESLITSRSTAA